MNKHQRLYQSAVCIFFSLFALASVERKKTTVTPNANGEQQLAENNGNAASSGGASAQTDKAVSSKAVFADSEWEVISAKNLGSTLSGNLLLDDKKSEDGRFIYVRFKVKNLTPEEAMIFMTPCVKDSQGRRFEELDWTDAYLPENETSIIGEALPASLGRSFSAIFEITMDDGEISFMARSFEPLRTEEMPIPLNFTTLQQKAESSQSPKSLVNPAKSEAIREQRAAKVQADLVQLTIRIQQLREVTGEEQYERLLGIAELEFTNFGALLDKDLNEASKREESRLAMLHKLAVDLERSAKEIQRKRADSKSRLTDARSELAGLTTRMNNERAQYQASIDTINRLTNFKRTPVQEGSAAYHQCVEASKVISNIEAGAPALKERKAELEALVKDLEKE
jgi:hypothetical protein